MWINRPRMRCRLVVWSSLSTKSALEQSLVIWGMHAEGKLAKNVKLANIPAVIQTSKAPASPTHWKHTGQEQLFPGFGLTEAWLWTWDNTAQRALKQNKWIQTQRRLDKWETERPPCLTECPHPSFIENQIPHHQHHDRNSNSLASHGACRAQYLFFTTTKESQVLFCINEVGESTITAVPLQVWQYPAGSLGRPGQSLWS